MAATNQHCRREYRLATDREVVVRRIAKIKRFAFEILKSQDLGLEQIPLEEIGP